MTENKAYLNLIESSFPGIQANILRCETLGFPWSSKPFLKAVDGEIASHVGFLEYPILIEGKQYKVGALHAICTKTDYRNQGLASELIKEVLDDAKEQYDFLILFTEIPEFYKKLSFQCVQEYRFHLPYQNHKGSQALHPVIFPNDNALFLRIFHERVPVSNHLWVKDNGFIASFNTLFATYPTYWSLYYSPSLDAIISYVLDGKTLHLFDVIANQIPSFDAILDHFPGAIDSIYFYFSPDRLIVAAIPETLPYSNEFGDLSGYLMVHGDWPKTQPFMISPLSRC